MSENLSLRLPEGWLRAVFAGIEAAVFSWLIPAMAGLVTYVATASAPGLGTATWTNAISASTAWWLTSFGGRMTLGEGTLTVIPLGMSLVSFFLLRGSLRRGNATTPAAASFAVVSYVLAAGLLGLTALERLGAYAFGFLALAVLAALSVVPQPLHRLPDWAHSGLRVAARTLLTLLAAALALVVVAVAVNWDAARTLHDALEPNVASAVVMVLLQLAYLPNAALWALAWLVGPGFAVGSGTEFSAFGTVTELLPTIPMLGALPQPGTAPGGWVLAIPVLLAAAVGALQVRRTKDLRLAGLRLAVAVPVIGLTLTLAQYLARGGIGPQRMTDLGADPWQAGLAGAALAGMGLFLGYLVPYVPGWMRALRSSAQHAVEQVRSEAQPRPEAQPGPAAEAPPEETAAQPTPASPIPASPAPAPTAETAPLSPASPE